MTDYKNLKLIASSSPHIRSKDNTRSIMLDVIIALLPALVMSIYVFGVRALDHGAGVRGRLRVLGVGLSQAPEEAPVHR